MAQYLVQDSSLTAIADAIREKTGSTESMTLGEMATAIGEISGGGETTSLYISDQDGMYISCVIYQNEAGDIVYDNSIIGNGCGSYDNVSVGQLFIIVIDPGMSGYGTSASSNIARLSHWGNIVFFMINSASNSSFINIFDNSGTE